MYMYVFFLCIYLQHVWPGALISQKKALDPLELKLQMPVSLHLGAGN